MTVAGARIRPRRPEPGHPASHNNRVGLWWGTLFALFLLIAPGAIIARITQLTWPIAIAVGPALTYGVVALAIIPFGAIGIPWNGWTALATLAVVADEGADGGELASVFVHGFEHDLAHPPHLRVELGPGRPGLPPRLRRGSDSAC